MENLLENEQLSERKLFLQFLRDVFSNIQSEVTETEQLTDAGIDTEFAALLDAHLADPINATFTSIENMESAMFGLLHNIVMGFLKAQKTSIKSLYRTYPKPAQALHYCIVLQDDAASRLPFHRYLNKYMWANYSKRFPIAFEFIPQEMEADLKVNEKLSLD